MIKIFVGSSYKGRPTGELLLREVKDFRDFCETYLKTCRKGPKNEHYITIGDDYEITKADINAHSNSYKAQDHYHRNNKSQISAWLLPFDGDSSISNKDSCVPPVEIHEILKKLNYNHVIYTTHSHNPPEKIRWRLFIPCKMTHKSQLSISMVHLLREINHPDLKLSNESKTWAIPWYLPTRDDPDDGKFKYYSYFKGRSFTSVDPSDASYEHRQIEQENSTSRSVESMIKIIIEGKANTGLHEATRDLAQGLIKDGVQPGAVKAILHGYTANYDMSDPRQKENKEKINALVDSAYNKIQLPTSQEWGQEDSEKTSRIYTKYPDQGGMFEKVVQLCMDWMIFPNRQIAVVSVHSLISTLGGRVYALPDGGGIVYTALLTGRSTIGKSNVKKFCVFALNNFDIGSHSHEFIGSHFYTSGKNLVKEIQKSGSLLSVRTESGQTDQSQAGDMKRVMLYELELSTESGPRGYVSSGGQNDKIPAMFSPAMTTVRESVAQIQGIADFENKTSISGVAGRRSHIIIDPIKQPRNFKCVSEIPKEIKNLLIKMYKKASDDKRKNVEEPLPPEMWLYCQYEDENYLNQRAQEWLEKENEAAVVKDHFMYTFYGRLYERIPSYAARLAIADNPLMPIITKKHIDIAEESLTAELVAHVDRTESGEDQGPMGIIVDRIVHMFKGDLVNLESTPKTKTLQLTPLHMRKDGILKWKSIMLMLGGCEEFKQEKDKKFFHQELENQLKARDIILLPNNDENKRKYLFRGKMFQRV
jgi:hypothetical protein